jgi:regulator of cell morphogenesis and NO signaling
MDIVDRLTRDHQALRTAFTALAAAPQVAAARAYAADLRGHAHAEDRLLFHELERFLPRDHGPLEAMRLEHEEIEALLDELELPEATPPSVAAAAARLASLVDDHFLKEEEVLFGFARRLIEPARLAALGAILAAESPSAGWTLASRVADLARERPETIRVFQRNGIDFCCGGKRSISEACERHGVDAARLEQELQAATGGGGLPDVRWDGRPAAELVGHILGRFHAGLRDELGRLEAMALRARERHGDHHPPLGEIADVVGELRREMCEHLDLEERELFPAILSGRPAQQAGLYDRAEREHETVGSLLARLRMLTDGYQPPAEACNTWRGLYFGLAELERDTHEHVHLENNVLFAMAS